jgi:hypothetical protein
LLILVWLDLQTPNMTAILICSVLTAQNKGKILSFLPCPFLTLFLIFVWLLFRTFRCFNLYSLL